MSERYYSAAIQTNFPASNDRTQIGQYTRHMCRLVEQTVAGYAPFFAVRLFVFPEFAHQVPVYPELKALHDKLAVSIPNAHTDQYIKLARKLDVYIQTGSFLEKDPAYPGHVFNTTLLIGPQGILSKYRKVNTWLPWEVHTSPADLPDYDEPLFPVVDTEIGRLGVATCYDWLFPECIRQIAFNGAEVINRVSAYMDPWGATPPMDWWTLINRTRALENMVYVVAANQAAEMRHYPPFSWPGSSMVIDHDGRILAQCEPGAGEKVVVAPIDLAALRAARAERMGHDTLAHHRSQAYTYASAPVLPVDPGKQSIERLNARIARSKKQLNR